MPDPIPPLSPSAVSVSDMARMVGLSRSRFHQLLQTGVFPKPAIDPESKRPFYDSEGQAVCLQVRQRNCGVNGKRVLFYARPFGAHLSAKPRTANVQSSSARKKRSEPKQTASKPSKLDLLVEGLKSLGLPNVTAAEASAAIHQVFPIDSQRPADEEVLLKVFRYLVRQNSGGNHGR
ncbi:MAG: hypothetical protein J0L61_00855 [Planctomycetes bacterium]|nr:hypothetical protein [Planctomycetota bacterium]